MHCGLDMSTKCQLVSGHDGLFLFFCFFFHSIRKQTSTQANFKISFYCLAFIPFTSQISVFVTLVGFAESWRLPSDPCKDFAV